MNAHKSIQLEYFAMLRERCGLDHETVSTAAATPGELFAELDGRYGLGMPPALFRVAVNGDYSPWDRPLSDGDSVVFIQPVAGG